MANFIEIILLKIDGFIQNISFFFFGPDDPKPDTDADDFAIPIKDISNLRNFTNDVDIRDALYENSKHSSFKKKYFNAVEEVEIVRETLKDVSVLSVDNEVFALINNQEVIEDNQGYINLYNKYFNYRILPNKNVPLGHMLIDNDGCLFDIPIEPDSEGLWIDVTTEQKDIHYLPPKDKLTKIFIPSGSTYQAELAKEKITNTYSNYIHGSYNRNDNTFLVYRMDPDTRKRLKNLTDAALFVMNLKEITLSYDLSPFAKDALISHLLKNQYLNKTIEGLPRISEETEFPVIYGINTLFKINFDYTFGSNERDVLLAYYNRLYKEILINLRDNKRNDSFMIIAKYYNKLQFPTVLNNLDNSVQHSLELQQKLRKKSLYFVATTVLTLTILAATITTKYLINT